MPWKCLTLAPTLLLAATLPALAQAQQQQQRPATQDTSDRPTARAELRGKNGQIVGTVSLVEMPGEVIWVTASFPAGTLPAGQHGFHIHEKGACAPDFAAAGGHFDPDKHAHGVRAEQGRHAGDLPNLHIPNGGNHVVEYFAPGLTLKGGAGNSLMDGDGSAFVVHADPDDYRSQPAGNSGDRIACGVIQRAR